MDIVDENGNVFLSIPDEKLEEYYDKLYCQTCIAECKEECKCDNTKDK